MNDLARQCAAMMHAMPAMHGPVSGNWGRGGMMGMGGMLFVGLLWLLIIVALITLLVVGVGWLERRGRQTGSRTPAPSARETLDRRYATGELDRETYLQMRADLEVAG